MGVEKQVAKTGKQAAGAGIQLLPMMGMFGPLPCLIIFIVMLIIMVVVIWFIISNILLIAGAIAIIFIAALAFKRFGRPPQEREEK